MEDPAQGNVSQAPASCGNGRVAFFGGSFDPPHLGHLAIARAARAALDLDRVLFAPVGAQPLKPNGPTASFVDRLAMTRLAIAGERGFEVSLADAPHSEGLPNYTLETLRKLRAGLPVGGNLFCLMGADSFAMLRRWHGAAEVPFAASLIVASRPGQALDDLARFLPPSLILESMQNAEANKTAVIQRALNEVKGTKDLLLNSFLIRNPGGDSAPFYVLPGLDIEISASEIRAQIHAASADPVARSLPSNVAGYIHSHALYR